MNDDYVRVQTPERMKKHANYLRGKTSYQDEALHCRIARQQIMVKEQSLKSRKAELAFLNERKRLIQMQTDLEIMFLVQDMNNKRKKARRR